MKGNIVYPIITTAIVAFVGIMLDLFGFDFKSFVLEFGTFTYCKELIFVLISFVIICIVIIWDILSCVYKYKLSKIEKCCDENKELKDTILKLEIKLEQKNSELEKANSNVEMTKKALTDLLEIESEIKRERALKNFKKDSQKDFIDIGRI